MGSLVPVIVSENKPYISEPGKITQGVKMIIIPWRISKTPIPFTPVSESMII
jgi:hypothetical protein